MSKTTTPRGIRNNNPLNIRIGNTWLGETTSPVESEFEVFIGMKYGIRAGFCILRRYIRKYRRNTIAKIIAAWAPSNENNTKAYINTVCKLTGLHENDPIKYEEENVMTKLVAAMCRVECGQDIDINIIKEAYGMA